MHGAGILLEHFTAFRWNIPTKCKNWNKPLLKHFGRYEWRWTTNKSIPQKKKANTWAVERLRHYSLLYIGILLRSIYKTGPQESEFICEIYSQHDSKTPNDVPWDSAFFMLIVWCIYVCVVSGFSCLFSLIVGKLSRCIKFCHDPIDNSLSRCTSSRESSSIQIILSVRLIKKKSN